MAVAVQPDVVVVTMDIGVGLTQLLGGAHVVPTLQTASGHTTWRCVTVVVVILEQSSRFAGGGDSWEIGVRHCSGGPVTVTAGGVGTLKQSHFLLVHVAVTVEVGVVGHAGLCPTTVVVGVGAAAAENGQIMSHTGLGQNGVLVTVAV